MQTNTADVPVAEPNSIRHLAAIKEGLKELAVLHRANKADDAEIRRLQASTRKKLNRIRENLRHVQATR